MNLNLEIMHKIQKKKFFVTIVYIYPYLNILQTDVYNDKIKIRKIYILQEKMQIFKITYNDF